MFTINYYRFGQMVTKSFDNRLEMLAYLYNHDITEYWYKNEFVVEVY